MNLFRPTDLSHLRHEVVQAYLDGLAVLSARHGIVIDSGSLMPRGADVGGYVLTAGGYLHVYPVGEGDAQIVSANIRDAFEQRKPRTLASDIAGLTAHELMRRSPRP